MRVMRVRLVCGICVLLLAVLGVPRSGRSSRVAADQRLPRERSEREGEHHGQQTKARGAHTAGGKQALHRPVDRRPGKDA